jgi:hypothetical protein
LRGDDRALKFAHPKQTKAAFVDKKYVSELIKVILKNNAGAIINCFVLNEWLHLGFKIFGRRTVVTILDTEALLLIKTQTLI